MKVFELTEGADLHLVPGVVDVSNLYEWIWEDIFNHGVNQTEERIAHDFEEAHGHPPTEEDWELFYVDEPTYLIGGWQRKDIDDPYSYAPCPGEHGFSAIVQWLGGAPIVTVVASKYYTTVRSMCSPCCPGQADLDSGYHEGGYACYSLPSEFYREEK